MSDATPPSPQPPNDGSLEFTTLTAEQLAPLFPRLEIGQPLAIGGMGAVYRARQPELDRPVALKILPPELSSESEYLERFRTEARTMAQLNHPNLVGVYDFGEVSGFCYLIMEYVEGQSLAELLVTNGSFGAEFALPVMEHVSEGISYAHGKGVVHLDLKPGNIMLNNEGIVKILDFGLAKLIDPTTGAAHEDMGTPDYAAPERFQKGMAIDHRADIFSIGIILYEMIVGKTPREGSGLASKVEPEISQRLDAIIQRCTRTDSSLRYGSATEIKADLTRVEKKVEQQLLKSPNAAKLLSDNASPQVAAAAKKFRRKVRRKMMLRKLRNLAAVLTLLGGLGFGAWKLNLIPESLLGKIGLPAAGEKMPPMFAELKDLYDKLLEQEKIVVENPRSEAVASLATKYESALSQLETKARQASDTSLLALIGAERNRYNDGQNVPDEFSPNAELAKLQNILKTEMDKIDATAKSNRGDLLGKYDRALANLLEKVEAEGRSEDAARVKLERERIASQL